MEGTCWLLPTGYGKSVIYQILPAIFDIMLRTEKSMVLVISPLNALMQDQITKLKDRGISPCMIQGHGVVVEGDASIDSGIKLPLDKLANPVFQLQYYSTFVFSIIYADRIKIELTITRLTLRIQVVSKMCLCLFYFLVLCPKFNVNKN